LYLKCHFGETDLEILTVTLLSSCRYGAAEPHAIAAFMGGKNFTCVSKVHTNQPTCCSTYSSQNLHYFNCFALSEQGLQSQTVVKGGIRTDPSLFVLQMSPAIVYRRSGHSKVLKSVEETK